MKIEPITLSTPRPVRRPVLVQRPAATDLPALAGGAGPLPAGTPADTLDGVTCVGLVTFRMRGAGLGPGPGFPYLGTFCETDVRLYPVDGPGRHDVVFRSLDAARLIPAPAGRLGVRLPAPGRRCVCGVRATSSPPAAADGTPQPPGPSAVPLYGPVARSSNPRGWKGF
ncbi:DUF2071 domain-containing protein [Streptomyces sp. NPDC046978]|uniref:DUF2071 domain-containing protein n=1 Tax=unclassified Streptomyces TaxID=2593676 RepID=UPI0033E78F0B